MARHLSDRAQMAGILRSAGIFRPGQSSFCTGIAGMRPQDGARTLARSARLRSGSWTLRAAGVEQRNPGSHPEVGQRWGVTGVHGHGRASQRGAGGESVRTSRGSCGWRSRRCRRRMPDPVRTAAVRAVIIASLTLIQAMVAFLCTLTGSWLAFPMVLSSVASTVVATWAVLDVWVTRQVWNQRNGVVSVPSSTARQLRRERRRARRTARAAARRADADTATAARPGSRRPERPCPVERTGPRAPSTESEAGRRAAGPGGVSAASPRGRSVATGSVAAPPAPGPLEHPGRGDLAVHRLARPGPAAAARAQVFLHADVLQARPQVGVVAQPDDQRELGQRRRVEQARGVEQLDAQRVRDRPLELQQIRRVGAADRVVEEQRAGVPVLVAAPVVAAQRGHRAVQGDGGGEQLAAGEDVAHLPDRAPARRAARRPA